MRQALRTPSGIAYQRSGPTGGLPVVLLHAGVADRRMWEGSWPDLTAARDCVRHDLRGYGESSAKPEGAVDHVRDLLDLLDHLGIARCHLVGASYGAGVAVEAALTRPAAVETLTLCPPGGSLLAEMTPDLRAFVAAEDEALERGDIDSAVTANIDTWVVGPGRSPSDVDPAVVAAVRAMQRRAFEIAEEWGDVEEEELSPQAIDRLPDVTARTLVLLGGHDLATTRDAADRVCAGIPSASRVDWPHQAHLPTMERPRDFTDLLLAWI